MRTAFDFAVEAVLEAEGGFVDHPLDHGGPTNFGVTQATYSRFKGAWQTRENVKAMTRAEAKQIYFSEYWQAAKLNLIKSECVQIALFDQVVNRGVVGGVKLAQKTVNQFLFRIATDGLMGTETASAINLLDGGKFCKTFIRNAQLEYATICQKNPTQLVFLSGWIRRTHLLSDCIELWARG